MNGDIKGAIAYMREHEEFKDVLPAYIAIFETVNTARLKSPTHSTTFCGGIRFISETPFTAAYPRRTLRKNCGRS